MALFNNSEEQLKANNAAAHLFPHDIVYCQSSCFPNNQLF